MESSLEFDLQEYIQNWTQDLKKSSSFTDSDIEELKSHFFEIVDNLKNIGLSEEEACYIASKRLGRSFEWEDDFKHANNSIIQLRNSIMILSGIIAYFFLYNSVLFLSKLFLCILLVSGVEAFEAVGWNVKYLVSIYFLLIIATVSIFFFENRTISFLDRIEFKVKGVIYFLLITFFVGVLNVYIYPILKMNFGDNIAAKSYMIKDYIYFDYTFPVLVCVCFLILYLRFYNKNKS